MTTITVSAMSPLPAVNATYTYGITNVSTEGKVAINASDGLPIYNGTALTPIGDHANNLGSDATRWKNLFLSNSGPSGVIWSDGAGDGSEISYNSLGPLIFDVTTQQTLQFDLQSLVGSRTVTFPDASGTVTLGANVADPTQPAPATGGTVIVAPAGAITVESVNPSGTLANLTLSISDGTYGGQIVFVAFSKAITSLAYGGTNITATGGLALPAAVLLGQCLGFVWSQANTVWTRFL